MLNEAKESLINQENSQNNISLTAERDSGVNYKDFDYEIDNPINSSIFTKINDHNNFPDQLAEKYYKCEPISIFSRNCL